jgi:hypothetical protein
LLAVLLLATACSADVPESQADGTWVGTITTEGNVTTVVNEAGSVWGGNARLVEELSIGDETGEEPYLFGEVRSLGATRDRIYVLERRLALVRVYDMSGAHLFDIGGEGQGPGEFNRPWGIAIDPAGRLLVQETVLLKRL